MARNGSGVKKASESSIEIEFQYDGQRCRERIKCKPTPANIRRLTLFRDEILDSIALGKFDYQATFPNSKRFSKPEIDNLTLNHWFNVFLDRKEPLVKSSTYSTYSKNIRLLRQEFGSMRVTEIKKRHVRDWCAGLKCGNKQISMLIIRLRDAIQCAVDDEIIDTNPLNGFSYRKLEEPDSNYSVDPLTSEELAVLLDSIDGQFKNMVKFAVWTGLRTSELIAVEWGDIDFLRGVVQIRRGKTQAARKAEATKTKSGQREVKLLPPALEALSTQKQHTFLIGKQVFLNGADPYTGDYQVWTAWRRALLKAGIRYRNPYQTRHTFASMMLSSGENISWLAKQMGHSNIMTTLKHYARFIPSDDQYGLKAVEMFAKKQT